MQLEQTPSLPLVWRIFFATVSSLVVIPMSILTNSFNLDDWFDLDFLTVGPTLNFVILGGTFGVLVLAPFVPIQKYRFVRMVLLIVVSICIYTLTVELAARSYGPLSLDEDVSLFVSGVLGALLVGIATVFLHLVTCCLFFGYMCLWLAYLED